MFKPKVQNTNELELFLENTISYKIFYQATYIKFKAVYLQGFMCIRPKTNFYVDFQEENKWNTSNGFFSFLGIVLLLIFGTTIFFGTLTGVANSDDLQLDIQSVMVISPVQENNTSGTIFDMFFIHRYRIFANSFRP